MFILLGNISDKAGIGIHKGICSIINWPDLLSVAQKSKQNSNVLVNKYEILL